MYRAPFILGRAEKKCPIPFAENWPIGCFAQMLPDTFRSSCFVTEFPWVPMPSFDSSNADCRKTRSEATDVALSWQQRPWQMGWELAVYVWRQFVRHRAEGMAAELTYRTIFSLIPVVVLGLVMFRIVGGLEDVQSKVEEQLYSFFGVPIVPDTYIGDTPVSEHEHQLPPNWLSSKQEGEFSLKAPSIRAKLESTLTQVEQPDSFVSMPNTEEKTNTEEAPSTGLQNAESRRQTRAGIRKALHEATAKVAELDFASIGVIGLLLFIYAAIALANATESTFNMIYQAPKHRPVHIRVAIHWSIITLGSGLLASSLYLSGQAVDWVGTKGIGSDGLAIVSRALSVLASWVLLFLLYALMPNTHVSVRAAAIGSFLGAIFWEGAKTAFQIYVAKALPYSALYGSLGLIPLFLFWIYVTWLIFLFGLIVTQTLQTWRGRPLDIDPSVPHGFLQGDPDWMLPIMAEVANAFSKGRSIDFSGLASRLGVSGEVIHEMTSKLIEANLLRRVTSNDEDALTLARPAENIELQEIFELAYQSRPTNQHPSWEALSELMQSERDTLSGKSLATILTG